MEAAQFVSKTVGEAVEWPSPIFIPDDPLELAFWDHKSCIVDNFSPLGAFMAIAERYDKNPSAEELERFYQGRLDAYVDYLLGDPKPTAQ